MSVNIFENGKLKRIAGNAKDFDAEGIPEKTTAQETDTALANVGGVTSRISFKDILEQISFSGMGTTEKTLAGAVNELRGNPGKVHVAAINLDNPPTHQIIQCAVGSTGIPEGVGGNSVFLIQQYPGSAQFSAQMVFGFNNDVIALRRKTGGNPWTEWAYFYPGTAGWKELKALDVTQADGNVIVDYSSLSPQPKEFCVRYGRTNGGLIYGGGAVTTPNQGGDPFWLPVYVNSLRHIGNAYIFVNVGTKTITLSFNDLPGAAGAPATAKFRVFYR